MKYAQVLLRGLVLISVCLLSVSAWGAQGGPPELPERMRGMSGPEISVNADLFTMIAKTDANVLRIGFSRD